MIRTAVAEDDRLHERGQPQMIHVILVDCGREQELHRLDVAAVAGGDQGGAAEAIDASEVRLRPQHQLEDLGTALGAGDEKRRVLDEVLGVDVGALVDEQAGDVDMIALRRRQERRAAAAVADIDAGALGQQPPDHQGLAALGRRDQGVLGQSRPGRREQRADRKQKGGQRRPCLPKSQPPTHAGAGSAASSALRSCTGPESWPLASTSRSTNSITATGAELP